MRGLVAVATGAILSGCVTGARHGEVLQNPDTASNLTRERDSLWIRTLALAAQRDAVRAQATRLEAALRERDEQLRASRLELQRLKEIDLRSQRKPPR